MKKIVIKQIKSGIGKPEKHKKIIRGLGLRKIGHTVLREDTPEIRGMVWKIKHLLEVVEGSDEA
ncbi:MAG: 50S ribosomal protein L30 [Nitrospirae bacterium RBG_16_43_11]|uniref:50S ribosomal protein L30 n=2 Tax=environmental samples TaxID=67798 RepID=A0A0H4TRN5_9BACT|nr:50S ribosomal protein L30, large subunit ribosomal protein L30 [uncultured Nitrospirae bacterium Rifle_16ft_4_minimus_38035]AKQ05296.1 50S ribosomal protein L30, large subunit ribosomal protein L30 [uncultured Nitrospirae bacterium Rifle_16ft_4_minimus_24026]OGW43067.1 MAG: 50S ribosomal protein L30 [Nitrospirae bacterium RBG_16_43_11]